ncbi:hypothetical protein CHUAL_004850 [Chamberlinius hualienensis]
MENLAIVFQNKKFQLVKSAVPEPGPNDALVKIDSVGICGTDLHLWHDGHVGDMEITGPHIFGHESGATIVKLGSNVTHLKPGDRVCLQPDVPCWGCEQCRIGRYNLCPNAKPQSLPPNPGHFQKYFVTPAEFCHKLPANVSLEEAALMEPLSCVLHAVRRAKVTAGQKVFIGGAGGIGLLTMLCCKAFGASEVCISDVRATRLEVAKKLGAEHILLADSRDAQAMAKKVENLLGGLADVTIDCSGVETAIRTAIFATKPGGLFESYGLPPDEVQIPMFHVLKYEIDIIASNRFIHTFPLALQLVSTGQVNVKPLITHRFKMQDVQKAFETAFRGDEGAIKVTIAPADS